VLTEQMLHETGGQIRTPTSQIPGMISSTGTSLKNNAESDKKIKSIGI
jgi:hypothetical protein